MMRTELRHCAQAKPKKKTGAFQAIPMVPNAEEHLSAALKRASRITPSNKLKNEAAKARNKASRKMDGECHHLQCIMASQAAFIVLVLFQSNFATDVGMKILQH